MDFLKKVLNLEDFYKPKSNCGEFAQPNRRASRANDRRLSRKEKRQTELLERRKINIMDLSTESIKSIDVSKSNSNVNANANLNTKPKTKGQNAVVKAKIDQKKAQEKSQKPQKEEPSHRWKMLQKWKAEKEERLKKEKAAVKKPIFRPAGATIPKKPTTLTSTFGLQNNTTFVAPKNIKPIPLNNQKSATITSKETSKKVSKAPTITSSRITRSQDPVRSKNIPTKSPKYSQFNKNINANSTINLKTFPNKTVTQKLTSKFNLPLGSKSQKRKSFSNKENQKSIDNLIELDLQNVNKKQRSVLTEKNETISATSESNRNVTEPTKPLKGSKNTKNFSTEAFKGLKNAKILSTEVCESPAEPRMKTRAYMERLKNNALVKSSKIVKSSENLADKKTVTVANNKKTTKPALKMPIEKNEKLSPKVENKSVSVKSVKSVVSESSNDENLDDLVENINENQVTSTSKSSAKKGKKVAENGEKPDQNKAKDQNTSRSRKSRKSISTTALETSLTQTTTKLTPRQRRETIFDVNTSLDEQKLQEILNPKTNVQIKNTRKSISAIEIERKGIPKAQGTPRAQKNENQNPKTQKSQGGTPNLYKKGQGRKSTTEPNEKENDQKDRRSIKMRTKSQEWTIENVNRSSRKSIGAKKHNSEENGRPTDTEVSENSREIVGRVPKSPKNVGKSPKNVGKSPRSKTSNSSFTDIKSSTETEKFCTPEKSSGEPPVYLSPFVTTSRGKRSIKPIENNAKRESILVKPNFDDTPEKSNKAAAKYYHDVLDNVIKRLLGLCEKWQNIKNLDENLPEDATDMIDVAIGQTQLLINKKFKQFRNLIYNCENGDGECPVNALDLQGFWDMVYIQVDNLDVRFNRLEEIKANNWQEILPVVQKPVAVVKKRAAPKPKPKQTASTVRSSVRDAIRAARQKANNKNLLIPGEEQVVFNGGFFSVTSPAKNKIVERVTTGTPHNKRQSLLTTVLSAEAKKSMKKKLDLNKTMPTPGRSILKKANSAKASNLNKTVLFADEDDL